MLQAVGMASIESDTLIHSAQVSHLQRKSPSHQQENQFVTSTGLSTAGVETHLWGQGELYEGSTRE